MCWQRSYIKKSESEFIVREFVYNGDVTRRRHGAADYGGIVCGNATQAIMSREGQDHTKRSQIANTSESYGGDLIIQRYDQSSWRVGLLQCSHSLKGARQVRGQGRISERELLGGHSGVEAGGRKGRGSDDESNEAQLPKSKASVRKEVDSEEHHSVAEADLPIAKEAMNMQGNG
ncbi:hypothetical protein BHE74_00025681 [Ensete ventricosum]|nr:hypothetical protein BHE74_00025681 [Ensete ventricosum]